MEDEDRGGKFWLWMILLTLGIACGAVLVFWIVGAVLYASWYAWGILGTLLVIGVVLIGFGYVWDRRHARTDRPAPI